MEHQKEDNYLEVEFMGTGLEIQLVTGRKLTYDNFFPYEGTKHKLPFLKETKAEIVSIRILQPKWFWIRLKIYRFKKWLIQRYYSFFY